MLRLKKLYKHQEEAVKHILKNNGSGALFMEVGTGKTLTALSCFGALKGTSDLRLLVVCPISLINAAWGVDINKFTEFTYCNLREGFKDADIYLINYESYRLDKYQKLISQIPTKMIVLDESQKIKNHSSAITKHLLKDRAKYLYRIVMTGTPAPNSETEYWAQMSFISDCMPDSFYRFRNIYFHLERNGQKYWGQANSKFGLQAAFSKGFKYVITSKKRQDLMAKMQPHIMWAKKKDCLDLPDQVDEIREIILSPSQMKVYKDMKRHMIAEIDGNLIVANLALTKLVKLRQITSGFVLNESGIPSAIADNSKLKELASLLESLGDQQVVIWCQFHAEIEAIKAQHPNSTTLYSLTKDRDQSINDFKQGKVQYLIAHPKSGGTGLTFTNAHTAIYFSMDYSYESFEQSKGRLHRPGQNHKCTYIYLLAKDTIDYDIYQALQNKEGLQKLYERIRSSKQNS